ncbi:hypothetical protein F4776DRAFT_52294 [Hypoxylon sp. NC0597]|nr:hypothetical protein F4776DRAFT_52294 [Hypoxylon sp. NC0597]
MHANLALAFIFASSSLVSAQSSNPGGPVQSLTSVTDQGTTGVMSIQTDTSGVLSIQTDTVISGTDSTASPTPSGSDTGSSTTATSGSSETSAAVSSSVSPAGAAPRETGYFVAAAAAVAAGFVGVVAAL